MNIKIECYVTPYDNKMGYVFEKNGRIVKSEIFPKTFSDNKLAMLENVFQSLCAIRNEVSHDDVLTIVVQNKQIVTSLRTHEEKLLKVYNSTLDKIFDTIELMDCRYRFIYLEKYSAIKEIKKGNIKELELEGIDSLLNMD